MFISLIKPRFCCLQKEFQLHAKAIICCWLSIWYLAYKITYVVICNNNSFIFPDVQYTMWFSLHFFHLWDLDNSGPFMYYHRFFFFWIVIVQSSQCSCDRISLRERTGNWTIWSLVQEKAPFNKTIYPCYPSWLVQFMELPV